MRSARTIVAACIMLTLSPATAVYADDESEANRLLVRSAKLMQQYEGIVADDPAHYVMRLNILRKLRDNLSSIVDDYSGSSLAVELVTEGRAKTLVVSEIEFAIDRLEQSIPAAPLLAEAYALLDQHDAMVEGDAANYEVRLSLLYRIASNLAVLKKRYPLSYENTSLRMDPQEVQREIGRLEQSILAAPLLEETYALLDQDAALVGSDAAHYEVRLGLLNRIALNLEALEKLYPLSDEFTSLRIDPQDVQSEISFIKEVLQAMASSLPEDEAVASVLTTQLGDAIARCWNPSSVSEAAKLSTITVGISMLPDGSVDAVRLIETRGVSKVPGQNAFENARRAILRCLASPVLLGRRIQPGREYNVIFDFVSGEIR